MSISSGPIHVIAVNQTYRSSEEIKTLHENLLNKSSAKMLILNSHVLLKHIYY